MKKSISILLAFVAGQATQLVIHGFELSMSMWGNRQIPVALAAGFVIFFALLAGVRISAKEQVEAKKESYKEWAEP